MAEEKKLAKTKGQPKKSKVSGPFIKKTTRRSPVQTPSKASQALPTPSPRGPKTSQRVDGRKPREGFPIVGIGASAGGFETFSQKQNKELRQARVDLKVARDRYATLFDFTPVGYLMLDGNGLILEANLTFCHFLGLSRQTVNHKRFEDYVGSDDKGNFRLFLERLQKKPGTQPSDILTLRHGESIHRVRLEGCLETMESSGMAKLFRIAVEDVTILERLETAQEEQKALMGLVVKGVMDAIVATDEEERIVLFNEAAEHMFRCPASSALGQSINRFIPERFREAHHRHHRRFGQDLQVSRHMGQAREIFGLRDDGEEFPIEATISRVELKKKRKGHGKKLFTVVLRDISERRQAREAIEKEQEFMAAILDTTAALIVVLDSQGNIVRFNRACEMLTGFSSEEIQNKPFWETVLPPNGVEEVKAYFQAFLRGQAPNLHENYWITKQKQLRWIAWSNTLIRDKQGEVKYLIASGIDRTRQRAAQETLEKERKFVSQVLDTTGALVVILDPDLRILRINRACEQMVRYSFHDLKGQPFVNLCVISGEDDQGARKIVEACQAGRLPPLFESAVVNPSRQLNWIQWESKAIYDLRGNIKYVIATGTDITARRRAEQQLQQSQEQLQAILDHSPVSIWVKNLQGQYMKVNRQFEKNVGLPENEILGKTDSQIFQTERTTRFYEIDNTILQTGKAYEWDEVSSWSGGIRIEHVIKFLLLNLKGKPYGLCGIATDITRRKQAETSLQETSQRLEIQQRELRSLASQLLMAQEEERRRVSRDLHDDVNQRLALLSLKLQTVEKGLAERHPVKHMIHELYESVADLSDDIRHLAYQYHPSILDDLGLAMALRSLCEDFEKWEGVAVTWEVPDGQRKFSQRVATCLYRVAQESLRNVSRHAQASAVHLILSENEQEITLEITDNGQGFEVDGLLSKGLGFVSMRERVRLVGGTLSVESQPGQGTTVKVRIPSEVHT